MEKIDIGRDRAERLVIGNGSPVGLLGSAREYKRVCTRSSLICGLGLMVAADPEGPEIHKRSLQTLRCFQSRLGNIPNGVGFRGQGEEPRAVIDTARAGSIDNSLWFIIGNYYTWQMDGDTGRLAEFWPSLQRAYTWLDYQDSNECGLLEVHEAMDWANLLANCYNSLGPNVLWYAVQKCMSAMAGALGKDNSFYEVRANDVAYKINTLLWVGPEFRRDLEWVELNRREWLYPIRATEVLFEEKPYFLPYMAFRGWEDRFDAFGNLAAVLFGMASEAQAERIFDYINRAGVDQPWPIKAIDPVVHPGEKDWREYYRLRNLNLPHHYQNGGAWPFLGGLYVAALVRAGRLGEAAHQLDRLAEMNRQSRHGGEWEFNDWFHGVSGRPSGFPGQNWSAAMYIFAHECVRRGEVPAFSRANGW
ncbi:MAG TPA: glycoside hydrolase 100 family protein [Symbiobacteriaceae bacterium]|nr:glycoside hydrolase 100 family protein [Symbiobacteriaceae bacterium]